MGRPKLKTTKKPVKLTLSPELRAEAEALAYANNESLSALVSRLLGDCIAAHPHLTSDTPPIIPPTDAALEASVRARVKAIAPLVDRIRKTNTIKK